MKIKRTHIPEKILNFRNKRISQENLMEQVQRIFEVESRKDRIILDSLNDDSEVEESNIFDFDLLEGDNIYHLSDIERICIDYRLRFLNSALFKAELPYQAISKIKHLEKNHNTSLKGFKIMAPAKVFKLKNSDDPLLFAPIGNQYYYLIHSWGRDLHPLRKVMMWPFRNLENFIGFVLLISLILTAMVPEGLFSKQQTTSEFFMIYFFMIKWVGGISIFYGVKLGKNFSSSIWRSRFYNA
ncbi:hypothetical protein ACKGJN_08395 [Gillisia sp. Q332]|uniref:hypothetical protein n=1 Tax=Gillisia xinjiangensis TaxID=3384765 RepID=UPI00391D0FB9